MADLIKSKFLEAYHVLKSELLHDPSFEFTDDSRQWVERVIDYNVPGGNLIRGLSLQAYLLVFDDIEDNSQTQRTWPSLMVEFQTIPGKMIDLISFLEGEKDLSKFSLSLHRLIVQYKTAYYSFYLSAACALLMPGENLDNHVDLKDIIVEMGIYYQVQDDYLDVYGDFQVLGKPGRDIEDFKCSWLVVKALELSNKEQKKILHENYGKSDPTSVAKVKALYKDLDLQV
ncbi:hypothetical protein TIFTF001_006220 [Ficus carica]|uniref:Farnesyl diphosphate synthase n=1 Tax=Ficus carica TaxID=3494 RepID=A0AA88CZI4_FICCA|nr:hypothetical protein TIFTF001_006220 [Ficus carica]